MFRNPAYSSKGKLITREPINTTKTDAKKRAREGIAHPQQIQELKPSMNNIIQNRKTPNHYNQNTLQANVSNTNSLHLY